LLPLWLPIIEEYFPRAQFILPIRHPVEVAHSLCKRDPLALNQCLRLWAVHVLEGERATRNFSRQFTTYDQLVDSPVEAITALARTLGLQTEDLCSRVRARVDPALRHHAKLPWPAGEPFEDLTLSIHQTLLSDAPGKEAKLDCLRREYYRHMDWK
jgi:hypothetical protein